MARLVRWQILVAILGILLVGGLLAQLSFTRRSVIVPVRGGIYIEGMIGTPQYLNPLLASSDADRAITALLFDGLSALEPDGLVVPALAERWEISADGTVYTCTLRSNTRWHDGQPVSSADVLFTLDMVRSPDLPDPNALRELWTRVQVQALDSQRLRFTLERPYTPFLSYTTLPLLPAHLLQGNDPTDLLLNPFNLRPVGTGPFRFEQLWEDDDGVLTLDLEVNPDYYRTSFFLEGLQIRFYRDRGAQVEALLAGEVDGAFGSFPLETMAQLTEQSDLVAYRAYMQACTILFLNAQSPILSDRNVRQAIVQGIDLNALLKGYPYTAFAANGPISPISWAYKPDLAMPPYDRAAAIAILDDAGWHDRDGNNIRDRDVRSLELTLLTQDIPAERVVVAHRIEQQLAPLGIAVRVLVIKDPGEFRTRVTNRDFDMLLYGWGQLGRDPDAFALWHSSQIGPQGLNLSSFQNEEVDALLEQARVIADRDLRTQLYWHFQEIFAQEVPALPLYYPVYTYVVRSRIRGVELEPLNELGDRFRDADRWYMRTQKVFEGSSQPATIYTRGR